MLGSALCHNLKAFPLEMQMIPGKLHTLMVYQSPPPFLVNIFEKKNQQLIESKNKMQNSPWVREGEEGGLECRKVKTRTLKKEGEIDKGKLTFENTVFPLHCS